MDFMEKFGYNLAFDAIIYSIENKRTDFNKNPIAIKYANKVKKLFNDVIRRLESILNGKDCFFVENLKEIVEANGSRYQNASREDFENSIRKFKDVITQLDSLRMDPQEFYNSQDSQLFLTLCNKIKEIYTDDPNVLREEILLDS